MSLPWTSSTRDLPSVIEAGGVLGGREGDCGQRASSLDRWKASSYLLDAVVLACVRIQWT